ncbi:hypothetical protein M3Y99_01518500 [Aphelenchoides fujianensis]|nr:hypothetical protein M3Y99_01518500 [Aphelenchoides fujianensis]
MSSKSKSKKRSSQKSRALLFKHHRDHKTLEEAFADVQRELGPQAMSQAAAKHWWGRFKSKRKPAGWNASFRLLCRNTTVENANKALYSSLEDCGHVVGWSGRDFILKSGISHELFDLFSGDRRPLKIDWTVAKERNNELPSDLFHEACVYHVHFIDHRNVLLKLQHVRDGRLDNFALWGRLDVHTAEIAALDAVELPGDLVGFTAVDEETIACLCEGETNTGLLVTILADFLLIQDTIELPQSFHLRYSTWIDGRLVGFAAAPSMTWNPAKLLVFDSKSRECVEHAVKVDSRAISPALAFGAGAWAGSTFFFRAFDSTSRLSTVHSFDAHTMQWKKTDISVPQWTSFFSVDSRRSIVLIADHCKAHFYRFVHQQPKTLFELCCLALYGRPHVKEVNGQLLRTDETSEDFDLSASTLVDDSLDLTNDDSTDWSFTSVWVDEDSQQTEDSGHHSQLQLSIDEEDWFQL